MLKTFYFQVSLPVRVPTLASITVAEPFTVRPSKKSARHRTTTSLPYTPPRLPIAPYAEERPELKNIPFTVRPTPKSNPYGSTVYEHDVELKSPFEDPIHNFGGNLNSQSVKHPDKPSHSSYNVEHPDVTLLNGGGEQISDYMDGGYKGLPNFNFPGVHDDRPDYTAPTSSKKPPVGKLQEHFFKYPTLAASPNKGKGVVDQEAEFQEYSDGDATFGDLKFHLPNDGSFPDQPSDSMLRDLPDMGIHPNYPSTEDTLVDLKDLYLKNPFGNDFIRLEVDAERFRHNKTASGGIHHIPLIINGYPDIVKKTRRNDDESKTKNIERNGESKPKNSNKRTGEQRPKNASRNNQPNNKPKNVNRMSDQKPKNVNRMGDLKPKNLNMNEELKAKSDSNKPQSKPMRTPHQESNHSRRKTKAPPPAAVKKVSNRNSASSTTPTSTTTTTTKSPFAAKVRERLPGLMQSLSNHASWVNRAWDLGAAAA